MLHAVNQLLHWAKHCVEEATDYLNGKDVHFLPALITVFSSDHFSPRRVARLCCVAALTVSTGAQVQPVPPAFHFQQFLTEPRDFAISLN